jgi:hypothetical protein
MDQSRITFVINGQTFSLRPGDAAGIGAIPAAERQQLIELLQAVQQHDRRVGDIARSARDRAASSTAGTPGAMQPEYRPAGAERLGTGDVDALMARLVAEDNRNRKSTPTREGVLKWVLGAVGAVILLVLIF